MTVALLLSGDSCFCWLRLHFKWGKRLEIPLFDPVHMKRTQQPCCAHLTTLSIPPIHAKLNFGRHSFGVPFSIEISLFDVV
jgi:hypothetical protein